MSYIFKKKKYVNGYINNLEVIGVPNIDGSMISNFSTSNYLRFSKTPNLSSLTNWQMYFQITTGSGTADQQLLGGLTTDRAGIEIGIISSKLKLWLGSVNATNHDISTDNAVIGTTTIKPLTKYWLKLEFTGKQYILSISENGKDYNGEIAIHSSLPIRTNELSICLDKYAGNRPFLGIFDLDGFYITSSGKYIWIPYKRSKYDYNFSVFGLPIITNAPSCEVSGFSTANYLSLPKNFIPNSTDFECIFKLKTSGHVQQWIFNTSCWYSFLGGIHSSGVLNIYLSSNASSWNVVSDLRGKTVLDLNTWYYVKYTYDGKTYNVYLSKDKVDWNLEISLNSTLSPAVGTSNGRIGCGWTDSPAINTTIDLTQSYIKINGKLWWNCFRTTDNVIHKSDGSSKDYDYITTKCYSLKRKFLKKGYINNFTTFGNPSFDGSVVSGFSSANYLTSNRAFNSNGDWEFVSRVNLNGLGSGTPVSMLFSINKDSVYATNFYISSTAVRLAFNHTPGSSWVYTDIATTVPTDRWIYIKYAKTGTTFTFYFSEDGEVFEEKGSYVYTSTLVESNGFSIGATPSQTALPITSLVDLSKCYIKVNGELWWNPYKRCKYEHNFTTVGTPIITNAPSCEVSGFSSSNYVKLPKTLNVSDGSSWDIVIKFKFNSQANYQGILGYTGTGLFRSEIRDSKFKLLLSSSTESFNIGQLESQILETNTDYWVKISYKDNLYKLEMSTNGKDYTTESSITSTTKIIFSSELFFGNGRDGVLDGSIDLTQSYIKVNDKLWWSCFKQTTDIVYEEDGSEEDYDYQSQIGYNCCAPIKRYYKYVPWKQPVLTADDSDKSFIVSASDVYNNESGYKAWRSFSSNTTSDSWLANTTAPSETAPKYYTMQSSAKLKFKSILMTNRTAEAQYVGAISSFKIQASDDGVDWVDLTETLSNTNNTSASSWNIEINSEQGYLYHRFVIYGSNTSNRTSLGHPKITADVLTLATYNDYDFYEIEGEKIAHIFTINATPENAIVMINGEERNTLRVKKGGDINWSVSLDGYTTQSGTLRLTEDTVLDIALREGQYYTFTINASNEHNNSTPVVVKINGEVTNSITAIEGTEITYSVDCIGYQSKYGTLTLTEDTVLNIVLIGNP